MNYLFNFIGGSKPYYLLVPIAGLLFVLVVWGWTHWDLVSQQKTLFVYPSPPKRIKYI